MIEKELADVGMLSCKYGKRYGKKGSVGPAWAWPRG